MPAPQPRVVVVTGASSGFGALTVRALGRAGHVVYAGMRATEGRNAPAVARLQADATAAGSDLRAVELDVADQGSADAAIARILLEQGRLDVVVHNAGHMVSGPTEAFLPEQLAALYDVNVVGTQRVNRAALPHLRERGEGLVVWVGSTSTRGGTPPFLAPYFAAKAGMDALAVSYAAELSGFGVETSIVVPGAFATGTNHFAHAGAPEDGERAAAYAERYGGLLADLPGRLAALVPPDADVATVADEIARVVGLPAGTRPFRTHVDPGRDGSEVVSVVADRVRAEFLRRIGLDEMVGAHATV